MLLGDGRGNALDMETTPNTAWWSISFQFEKHDKRF